MSAATVSFDHVHLLSREPRATAQWYSEHLGGRIVRDVEVKGAPQVDVAFGGFVVIVRGQRNQETAEDKSQLHWGVDHFGLGVQGDFDAFCQQLKSQGVRFSVEPKDFNETTRIAFIEAPDGVSVELLSRKEAI